MKKITIMVLLLLTISLLFSCNQEDSNYRPTPVPKKYYLYKTDDGWRICIEGYKCVHPDPAGVQFLGELKRKLLNDEFSLAEKGSMEANLPMDEEGRYYLSDLDNLYEPYFPDQFSVRCFDSKSWCLFREGLIANLDDTLNDDSDVTCYYFYTRKDMDEYYDKYFKNRMSIEDSYKEKKLQLVAHYDKEDHHYYYDSNLLLWYNSEKINNHVYEQILIDAVLKERNYNYKEVYRIYSENEFTHNGFTYRICAEYFSENSYMPHKDYVPVSYDLFVYNDDACFLFRGLKYYDRLPSKEYITSFGFLPISEE